MSAADIRPLRELVREHIIRALEASHWRVQIAAGMLGITDRHVYNKIREYNIDLSQMRRQSKLHFPRKHF